MTVPNDCISSSDVYLLMQTRFCRWQHLLTAQEVCMKRKKSLPTSAFSWIPKNFYWNWATYRWSMYEQKKSLPTPAFSCISKNFCWNWATYGLEQSETDFVYLTPSWLNLLPVSNREICMPHWVLPDRLVRALPCRTQRLLTTQTKSMHTQNKQAHFHANADRDWEKMMIQNQSCRMRTRTIEHNVSIVHKQVGINNIHQQPLPVHNVSSKYGRIQAKTHHCSHAKRWTNSIPMNLLWTRTNVKSGKTCTPTAFDSPPRFSQVRMNLSKKISSYSGDTESRFSPTLLRSSSITLRRFSMSSSMLARMPDPASKSSSAALHHDNKESQCMMLSAISEQFHRSSHAGAVGLVTRKLVAGAIFLGSRWCIEIMTDFCQNLQQYCRRALARLRPNRASDSSCATKQKHSAENWEIKTKYDPCWARFWWLACMPYQASQSSSPPCVTTVWNVSVSIQESISECLFHFHAKLGLTRKIVLFARMLCLPRNHPFTSRGRTMKWKSPSRSATQTCLFVLFACLPGHSAIVHAEKQTWQRRRAWHAHARPSPKIICACVAQEKGKCADSFDTWLPHTLPGQN